MNKKEKNEQTISNKNIKKEKIKSIKYLNGCFY